MIIFQVALEGEGVDGLTIKAGPEPPVPQQNHRRSVMVFIKQKFIMTPP